MGSTWAAHGHDHNNYVYSVQQCVAI